MTVHHDKMAYGRLAKSCEDLSEERIAVMLKELNEGHDAESDEATEQVIAEESDEAIGRGKTDAPRKGVPADRSRG